MLAWRAALGRTVGILVLSLGRSSVAHAEQNAAPPPGEGRDCRHGSFVDLTVDASLDTDPEEVMGHLRAGLKESGISVCWANEGTLEEGGALARLVLRGFPSDDVAVSLVIRDQVTVKRVEKKLRLADLPASSRSLAIAVHLQELLRASWAETLLEQREESRERSASTTEPPPPSAVSDFVEPRVRGRPRLTSLELGASGTLYSTGLPLMGVRLEVSRLVLPFVEFSVGGEVAWSTTQFTELGSVRAASQVLALGALLRLTAESSLTPYFGTRALVRRLVLSPVATEPGVEAVGGEAWGADIGAGLGVRWFVSGSWMARCEVGLLYAVAPIWATEAGVRSTGAAGVARNTVLSWGTRW